jgi:hypothetical protein
MVRLKKPGKYGIMIVCKSQETGTTVPCLLQILF